MVSFKTSEELIHDTKVGQLVFATNFIVACFFVVLTAIFNNSVLGFTAVGLYTISLVYFIEYQSNIIRYELRVRK